MGRTRPLFFVFSAQLTINKCSIKVCRWLDSNRRSLVSEVTALPTEPHHCPTLIICKTIHLFQIIYKSYTKKTKKLHQCVLLKNVLNICKTIHLFQIIQWRPLQRTRQQTQSQEWHWHKFRKMRLRRRKWSPRHPGRSTSSTRIGSRATNRSARNSWSSSTARSGPTWSRKPWRTSATSQTDQSPKIISLQGKKHFFSSVGPPLTS